MKLLTIIVSLAMLQLTTEAEENKIDDRFNRPFSNWDFVALVSANEKGEIEITILKDHNNITKVKKSIPEIQKTLLDIFKRGKKAAFILSVVDIEGKRFSRHKPLKKKDVQLIKDAYVMLDSLPRPLREKKHERQVK